MVVMFGDGFGLKYVSPADVEAGETCRVCGKVLEAGRAVVLMPDLPGMWHDHCDGEEGEV